MHTATFTPSTDLAPASTPAVRRSHAALRLAAALSCYALGCAGIVALIAVSFGAYDFHLSPKLTGTVAGAAVVGTLLVGLFGVQHTIMARVGFKRRWSRVVGADLERSIFVALSGLLMLLILWGWQPLPGTVWRVGDPVLAGAVRALQGAGWAYLFAATFTIGHFDLFGVARPWRALVGRPEPAERFTERLMYRFDRHPIMSGVMIGLWCTPHMRVDLLLLAVIFTAYIAVGVAIEERELVRTHGATYRSYRERVGSLVPRLPFATRALRGGVARV